MVEDQYPLSKQGGFLVGKHHFDFFNYNNTFILQEMATFHKKTFTGKTGEIPKHWWSRRQALTETDLKN